MTVTSATRDADQASKDTFDGIVREVEIAPSELVIQPDLAARFLFSAVVFLGVTDIVLQTIDATLSPSIPGWVQVVKMFDLDREFSFPTWYSIMLLMAASVLFGLIAWATRRAAPRCGNTGAPFA
ncbi:MAG: hypothetical protein R2849_05335 [Thermomicrobiales bacterium]